MRTFVDRKNKRRRTGALNTPLFSRQLSFSPSHRIRLDKTRTRGREGWQPHPPSHEVAQHVQAWSLAAGMVRDSPGRSRVVRSLLSLSRTYVHTHVRTYTRADTETCRYTDLDLTHVTHATQTHSTRTTPRSYCICRHAGMCWLAFQPYGWMGVGGRGYLGHSQGMGSARSRRAKQHEDCLVTA